MKKTLQNESKKQRKLTLTREALRRLSLGELEQVVGGALCPHSAHTTKRC
jgi:hypothetical protein